MAGLPKKYAKMGFKKGWKAYRAAKRGGTTKRKAAAPKVKYRTRTVTVKSKRRRPSVTKKAAPRRRRRSAGGAGFKIGRAFTGKAAQKTATQLGAGVGGAVGSAMVIRAIPGLTPTVRSWSQMLGSAVVMFALPRRMELAKIAAAGASLAGAFSIMKTTFPQFPLMAGENMGVNFLPRSYRRPVGARQTIQDARANTIMRAPGKDGAYMGMNKSYGGPAGNLMGTYGREFVTPADL